MEVILGLLFLGFFLAPLIVAIVALVKSHAMRSELDTLRTRIAWLENDAKAKDRPQKAPTPPEHQEETQVDAPGEKAPPVVHTPAKPPPSPEPLTDSQQPESTHQSSPPPLPASVREHERMPEVPDVEHDLNTALPESPPPEWIQALKKLIFEGNPIAKIAVIVILFGVGFAIKLAAIQGFFPLELRLSLVALAGLAMVIIGWVLKDREITYSRILMGGGLAVLYLTFFGAGKIWALIPLDATFALMVVSVFSGTVIAYRLHSQPLGILAFAGGFAAPLLVPLSDGGHLFLFAMYGVFNVAIAFLVRAHQWRWLALFGFFCTFCLGSIWGAVDYHANRFHTTEPFLVAHWLLYLWMGHFLSLQRVAVMVTLVLGPTLAAFGLQSLMLKDQGMLLAFSTVVGAAIHAMYGYSLTKQEQLPLLKDFHGIIALGLVTLSIPLALSEQWTSAAWSVEAVAVLWIGMRSQRNLLKIVGLGLLLASGVTLWIDMPSAFVPKIIGCALISGSALVCTRLTYPSKTPMHQVMAYSALAWCAVWLGQSLYWISERWFEPPWEGLAVGWACVVLLCTIVAHSWTHWRFLHLFGLALPAFAALIFAEGPQHEWTTPAVVLSALFIWTRWFWADERKGLDVLFHLILLWCLGWQLAVWLEITLKQITGIGTVWLVLAYPMGMVLLALPLLFKPQWIPWRFLSGRPQLVAGLIWAPVAVTLFLMCLFLPGTPTPLPYVPLVNPLELAVMGFALLVWVWRRSHQKHEALAQAISTGLIALGFALSVGLASRCAHHFWAIPWEFEKMFESSSWQAMLAIEWALMATVGFVVGSMRNSRPIWFAGAILSGIVVLKLFMVDLRFVGATPRVVTFLAVGLLLLFVGYKAPLPPKSEE